MDSLTAKQVEDLNNVTRKVHLGTLLQEVITNLHMPVEEGTPVNAISASKLLTLTGVVVDGEKITINNPLIDATDVYEFLADVAQTKFSSLYKAVNIEPYCTKSSVVLTVDTQPTNEDTMTIGGKVYTFVPNGTAGEDGEISRGTSLATAKTNIVAAINGIDGHNTPNPVVSAAAFSSNNCTITALVGGTAGDAITCTETFTAVSNIFAAGTLGGGADCSAANACTALLAAVAAEDTQGVGATAGEGTTVLFTADVGGVGGNDIEIAETLVNATFAGDATKLSGGVNGTVGSKDDMLLDASYLYFCVANNTLTGKNWRRVSLGSAY